MPHHEMRTAVHRCASTTRRADILGAWSGKSKLEKLKSSVKLQLPKTWSPKKVEEYATKVEAMVRAAWSIFSQARLNASMICMLVRVRLVSHSSSPSGASNIQRDSQRLVSPRCYASVNLTASSPHRVATPVIDLLVLLVWALMKPG